MSSTHGRGESSFIPEFFQVEKQRTLQRKGWRRKGRQIFSKRPCRASMGEPKSASNFLGPFTLFCEHPPSSRVPSSSFSFPTWPKRRQAVCCLRAGAGGAAQLLALEGLGSQRMSLIFAISSGLAKLETCIPRQADYCCSRRLLPLLNLILPLPPFCRAAIISQGP